MDFNWRALFAGLLLAFTLEILILLLAPFPLSGGFLLLSYTLPGLVGGAVAGYMVADVGDGAIHGGIAMFADGVAILAVSVVAQGLSVLSAFTFDGFGIVLAPAVLGLFAGAFGGWTSSRGGLQETLPTETR